MTSTIPRPLVPLVLPQEPWREVNLLQGEVILETRSHSAWGGAVTAHLYLPLGRSQVWHQVTDYPRWVEYFPNIAQSKLLAAPSPTVPYRKRLFQVGQRDFLWFTAQVEIYLQVTEIYLKELRFSLEQGSFSDFSAHLMLRDYGEGTLLTYGVQATPLVPVPSLCIQQAIKLDLPANLRQLRTILCQGSPA